MADHNRSTTKHQNSPRPVQSGESAHLPKGKGCFVHPPLSSKLLRNLNLLSTFVIGLVISSEDHSHNRSDRDDSYNTYSHGTAREERAPRQRYPQSDRGRHTQYDYASNRYSEPEVSFFKKNHDQSFAEKFKITVPLANYNNRTGFRVQL